MTTGNVSKIDSFSRMIELIDAVGEATQQNKIEWKPTAQEDCFQAALPDYSLIVVRERGRTTSTSILWGEDAPRYEYFVEIRDSAGDLIDEISARDLGGASKSYRLAELFTLARRSALRSMDAISEIVKSLKELKETPS